MGRLVWFGWILIGVVGMEALSYVLHRFVLHGVLWSIHRTHHRSNTGLELNDLFSLFFGLIAIILYSLGSSDRWHSPLYALAIGISVYGVIYFIAHDAYTHRRIFAFRSSNTLLRTIRKAHQQHHQNFEKKGQEPYGLFSIRYRSVEETES